MANKIAWLAQIEQPDGGFRKRLFWGQDRADAYVRSMRRAIVKSKPDFVPIWHVEALVISD